MSQLDSFFHFCPTAARKLLLVVAAVGAASSLHAQTIIASGTVSGVPDASPGFFDYTLTFSEGLGTTTPIHSIWYSWVPGGFFLPDVPTSVTAAPGWSGNTFINSIQFSSSGSAFDIAPGSSLVFHYVADFSPAQLAAAPNSGVSFAYAGTIDASFPQEQFTVQAVPEPATVGLLAVGLAGIGMAARRRRN